jgi:hypothetical protein
MEFELDGFVFVDTWDSTPLTDAEKDYVPKYFETGCRDFVADITVYSEPILDWIFKRLPEKVADICMVDALALNGERVTIVDFGPSTEYDRRWIGHFLFAWLSDEHSDQEVSRIVKDAIQALANDISAEAGSNLLCKVEAIKGTMQVSRLWEEADSDSYLQLRGGKRYCRVEVGRGDEVYPLVVDEPQVQAIAAHILQRISRDLLAGRLVLKPKRGPRRGRRP